MDHTCVCVPFNLRQSFCGLLSAGARQAAACIHCAASVPSTSSRTSTSFPSSDQPSVECRAASADGSVRTLVLSVADAVQFMEGRRLPRHQAEPRWIDAYQVRRRCNPLYDWISHPEALHSLFGVCNGSASLQAMCIAEARHSLFRGRRAQSCVPNIAGAGPICGRAAGQWRRQGRPGRRGRGPQR